MTLVDLNDKWVKRFLNLGQVISEWSKDPRTKVGCVIAEWNTKRIRGTGYNGPPRLFNDEALEYMAPRDKYKITVHAETNALINASMVGPTRINWDQYYVAFITFPPCNSCLKVLVESGMSEIVFIYDAENPRAREWFGESLECYQASDIKISWIRPENVSA